MLGLCDADRDLWPVRSMITAVPILDVLRGFGFEVDRGPIHEHHVQSHVKFFCEDLEEVSEDLMFVFSKDRQGAVECIILKGGEVKVVQK